MLPVCFVQTLPAQNIPTPTTYPALPSETPAKFAPVTDSFDYVKRDVMIPMRDGVKLHTVILVPKGAKGAPILLTRTPYNANELTSHAAESRISGPILHGYDNATDVIVEGGYIRVVQDVRGKYGSEGDYVMNRPLARAAESDAGRSCHRHLRHHRLAGEERSRRATARSASWAFPTTASCRLMALVNPHPALKVSVPMNPMVDGWMGDDWFHNGAFRQQNMPYIYEQEATREVGRQVVDEPLRRLRHVHAGGIGGRTWPPPRPRAGRLLAEAP